MNVFDKRGEKNKDKPFVPIEFVEPDENGKVVQQPIEFFDHSINSELRYAILKTTENGKFVRGNLLFYSLNGVEVYTELNNIIFVDEANKTMFIRDYSEQTKQIAPEDPEEKQYLILYTDKDFDEYDNDVSRWEAFIGRSNAYEAIKNNLYTLDPDRSIILVDNVPLKDALSIREFVAYLVNAEIVPDEINFDDYD